MRKKAISTILIICFCFFSTKTEAQNAESATAGSYHATAISMVFWGVLLVAGMSVAAILISSHSE